MVEHLHESFNVAHGVIRETVAKLQDDISGVYRMLSKDGRVLYIGKAKDLKRRLRCYFGSKGVTERVRLFVRQIASIDVTVTENETEALLLEARLIKELRPKYNVIMRDDKYYPYIAFSRHKYPRILHYRERRREKTDGVERYGPFLSTGMTKHIITALKKAFQIRTCTDSFFVSRDRPCIEYEMHNCSAPCAKQISENDYLRSIAMAQKVLLGKSKDIQRELFDAMRKHSDNLDYESAILCRDRLQALRSMQECMAFQADVDSDVDFVSAYKREGKYCIQILSFQGGMHYGSQPYFIDTVISDSNLDVLSMFFLQVYNELSRTVYVDLVTASELELIGTALKRALTRDVSLKLPQSKEEVRIMKMTRCYAMEALNRRMHDSELGTELSEFSKFFGLTDVPERIEVYDNSHISGSHPYGVMVVCGRDGLNKREYKKFKIGTVTNGDDYSMMREVLSRRFKEISVMPDFILIDGGRGHLSAVRDEIAKQGIPFACMAKGPGRVSGTETFYFANGKRELLDPQSKLMHFLCRLRDEAHRFAISSHRRSRDSRQQFSSLHVIPGVGKTKGKAVIAYFGSLQALKSARVEEISKVPGISLRLAERISAYLKGWRCTVVIGLVWESLKFFG